MLSIPCYNIWPKFPPNVCPSDFLFCLNLAFITYVACCYIYSLFLFFPSLLLFSLSFLHFLFRMSAEYVSSIRLLRVFIKWVSKYKKNPRGVSITIVTWFSVFFYSFEICVITTKFCFVLQTNFQLFHFSVRRRGERYVIQISSKFRNQLEVMKVIS